MFDAGLLDNVGCRGVVGFIPALKHGAFSSIFRKFDDESGSKIESRDPYDIETVVLELLGQLARSKRHLGGRIVVREWIPHDVEVRAFVRDGSLYYWGSLDDVDEPPIDQIERVAETFEHFAWSADWIKHRRSGSWYLIDMGLDGLYHTGSEWHPISGHVDETKSPGRHIDAMVDPDRYLYRR